MIEKLKDRNNQIILSFIIIFVVLILRLSILTVVKGDEYREVSENRMRKYIPLIAKRGEITDRNGELLAGNIPGFTVQMVRNDLPRKELNEIAIKTIDILDKKKENHIEFPILLEDGEYHYTYDKEIEDWLRSQGYEKFVDAETVFNEFVAQHIQVKDLDKYEAQKILISKGIILPISIADEIKYLLEKEKENFLKSYNLDEGISAKEAFNEIKDDFSISQDYTDEDARKIMIIRHALKEQGYRKYEPLRIASNISKETAILIEEMGMELQGISVYIEPIRNYPNDKVASHTLGYLGKIATDMEINKYVEENRYSKSDIIGKTGIEGVYELELKGENGAKSVEVDAYGRTVKELDYIKKPKPGKDIKLTIDLGLQKIAEESLKHALEEIQIGGKYKSNWGDYNYSESFPNAKSASAVAVDVKTGEILALANYPSYDPNKFTTGISTDEWKKLQPDNKRDPIAPSPLYNVSALTAVQPGSTFKMITGLAGIEQGLDPAQKLYDGGRIIRGNKSFGCWFWNQYKGSHGHVDLYEALEVSCNYYFFDVANGYDYAKKKPLPIKMNTEIFLDYAKRFGLGDKTGIEIGEVAYGVPDPNKKARALRALLKRKLSSIAEEYFPKNILNSEEKLNNAINQIVEWSSENPSRGALISRLKDINVIESKAEALADLVKYSYYNQMNLEGFREGEAFNLSIGQGAHAYTPLQMARYISGIVNGGYLNELSIVKQIGEKKVSKVNQRQKIDLNDDINLEHIKKGMLQVTQGPRGTARGTFGNFPVLVGAKTGTAERHGKIPPKDEVEYLKKNIKKIVENTSYKLKSGSKYRLTLSSIEEETQKILKLRNEELVKLESEGKNDEIINKIRYGYFDKGSIMREAIKKLSYNKITDEDLDMYKDNYDNFAWFVSFAPYDDPQIAVVVLIFQGGHGGYGSPVAREIIAEHMGLNKQLEEDKLQEEQLLEQVDIEQTIEE